MLQCKDRCILLTDLFPPARPLKRRNCSGSSRFSQLGLAVWGGRAAPTAAPAPGGTGNAATTTEATQTHNEPSSLVVLTSQTSKRLVTSSNKPHQPTVGKEHRHHLLRDSLASKKEIAVVGPDSVSLISLITGLFLLPPLPHWHIHCWHVNLYYENCCNFPRLRDWRSSLADPVLWRTAEKHYPQHFIF